MCVKELKGSEQEKHFVLLPSIPETIIHSVTWWLTYMRQESQTLGAADSVHDIQEDDNKTYVSRKGKNKDRISRSHSGYFSLTILTMRIDVCLNRKKEVWLKVFNHEDWDDNVFFFFSFLNFLVAKSQ